MRRIFPTTPARGLIAGTALLLAASGVPAVGAVSCADRDDVVHISVTAGEDSAPIAVASAAVVEEGGRHAVDVTMCPEGARTFGELTGANVGRPIVMRLGDEVLGESVIRQPILGGTLRITGDFDEAEAQALAASLSGDGR